MRKALALLLALSAAPVAAAPDHPAIAERAVRALLPASAAFAEAAEALAEAAPPLCAGIDAEALRDRFHTAWDAWMRLQHLRFGPLEEENRALQIAFWPDSRGRVGKAVVGVLASAPPALDDPAAFATLSVAARGLPALERLLYDEDGPVPLTGAHCRYVAAAARDLAGLARAVDRRWQDPWAGWLQAPGVDPQSPFLAPEEVSQRLFSVTLGALEETARSRLAKPLGTFERPRPRLAEARRSGRSLRHIRLVIETAETMALGVFGPELTAQDRGDLRRRIDTVRHALDRVEAVGPLPAAIRDHRLRVEILQRSVEALASTLGTAAGSGLGIAAGFNSADGD